MPLGFGTEQWECPSLTVGTREVGIHLPFRRAREAAWRQVRNPRQNEPVAHVPQTEEVYPIMLKKEVVRALLLAAVFSSCSQAADIAGRLRNTDFSVFAMTGGSTLFDGRYFTSADQRYHSSYETGSKTVIGMGVPLGSVFTIETSYTFGQNNLLVTNTSRFPHVGIVYPTRNHILTISAVARSPIAVMGFRPYAAAGWDYARYVPTIAAEVIANNQGFGSVSYAQLTDTKRVGVSLGVGVEHRIVGRLNFRLEARDHIASSPNYGLPKSAMDSAIFPVSGYANNVVYTVGLIYRFGKKHK